MLQNSMKKTLANTFALYLKAHGYHWNVKGILFPQLHDFFGDLYEEWHGQVDSIAEQIRALNMDAPAGLDVFSSLRTIPDGTATSYQEMLLDLYQGNAELISTLTEAYDDAEAAREIGLSNFLQDLVDKHKKNAWMLRSTIMGAGMSESTQKKMDAIHEKYNFGSWTKARRK